MILTMDFWVKLKETSNNNLFYPVSFPLPDILLSSFPLLLQDSIYLCLCTCTYFNSEKKNFKTGLFFLGQNGNDILGTGIRLPYLAQSAIVNNHLILSVNQPINIVSFTISVIEKH